MAFVYDTFVTGKNFIGRKAESNAVRNLLGHGTSVCIYEPPKAGKMSVIQQALFNMRLSGVPFTAPQADLFNCRDTRSLALKLASSIIRSAASTPAEYAGIIETMLKDTRFHFDQTAFSENDEVVCLDGKGQQAVLCQGGETGDCDTPLRKILHACRGTFGKVGRKRYFWGGYESVARE